MQKLIYLFVMIALVGGCAYMIRPSPEQIAVADYGRYPDDYEQIAQNWINNTFFDPYSIRDLTIGIPEKRYFQDPPILGGTTYYGYYISVTCNAKNRMGGYVGKKTNNLLVHNGVIIKQWDEDTIMNN